MPGEFQIIREYFQRDVHADGLVLGIGDDGAVLRPRAGFDQVVVTDTLVAGRHFPVTLSPEDIGWRALAVNLSDVAAMGATPRFAFLNLTLDAPDAQWLHGFAAGFFQAADASSTVLAGGDTTQGPLSVTVTVIGEVPAGQALARSGAKAGDAICVSGAPGEAAAGLERLQQGMGDDDALVERFRTPVPRIALGVALRGVASAAIDVSDGLIADLAHILDASGVGATVHVDALPVSRALAAHASRAHDYVLAGGDDYELCFCAPREQIDALRDTTDCAITVIGEITATRGVNLLDGSGNVYVPARRGWEHFETEPRQ